MLKKLANIVYMQHDATCADLRMMWRDDRETDCCISQSAIYRKTHAERSAVRHDAKAGRLRESE